LVGGSGHLAIELAVWAASSGVADGAGGAIGEYPGGNPFVKTSLNFGTVPPFQIFQGCCENRFAVLELVTL
jgi:hypothetical protein